MAALRRGLLSEIEQIRQQGSPTDMRLASDEDGRIYAPQLLQYGDPLSRHPLMIGVYLDDLGVLLVTDLKNMTDETGPDK